MQVYDLRGLALDDPKRKLAYPDSPLSFPKPMRYLSEGHATISDALDASELLDPDESRGVFATRCYCPDDCNCHYSWRTNYCGCRQHETQS